MRDINSPLSERGLSAVRMLGSAQRRSEALLSRANSADDASAAAPGHLGRKSSPAAPLPPASKRDFSKRSALPQKNHSAEARFDMEGLRGTKPGRPPPIGRSHSVDDALLKAPQIGAAGRAPARSNLIEAFPQNSRGASEGSDSAPSFSEPVAREPHAPKGKAQKDEPVEATDNAAAMTRVTSSKEGGKPRRPQPARRRNSEASDSVSVASSSRESRSTSSKEPPEGGGEASGGDGPARSPPRPALALTAENLASLDQAKPLPFFEGLRGVSLGASFGADAKKKPSARSATPGLAAASDPAVKSGEEARKRRVVVGDLVAKLPESLNDIVRRFSGEPCLDELVAAGEVGTVLGFVLGGGKSGPYDGSPISAAPPLPGRSAKCLAVVKFKKNTLRMHLDQVGCSASPFRFIRIELSHFSFDCFLLYF